MAGVGKLWTGDFRAVSGNYGADFGLETRRTAADFIYREMLAGVWFKRLFAGETTASSVFLRFASGCWRALPRQPTARSDHDPRQGNASCRGLGTIRRCVPRCRRESAGLL